MKNVLLVVATNRAMDSRTQSCMNAVRMAGAAQLITEGSSDVAIARNISLSMAVRTMEMHPDRDVALFVDDDMVFSVEQAAALCVYVAEKGVAASAVYSTSIGEVAANSELSPTAGKWLAGFGFLAVPRAALFAMAERVPKFQWKNGQDLYCFTDSALHEIQGVTRWVGEDYWFCYQLGGVDLLPIAVGHLKTIPLFASDETLQKIAAGTPLDVGEPEPFRVETAPGEGVNVKQERRAASKRRGRNLNA